jgi:DNA-binding winged helix-turn-helix (wHTH) protein
VNAKPFQIWLFPATLSHTSPAQEGPLSGLVYQFGEFWLDCGAFQLLRNGHSLRVERKPMELLILLASREGQLVTRGEIADRLWASEVFVDTEHGINTAIRKLRYLLRDDPDNPQFIQTVVGRGYRFIAPVTTVQGEPAEAVPPRAASVEPAALEPVQLRDSAAQARRGRHSAHPESPLYRVDRPYGPGRLTSLPSSPLTRVPWANACSIATRNPSSPRWP